eukprot:TRINITY_DN10704_c0_g1_i1.p1 TRINITY_DN10704_c0_g1~~TRINITY_DN10704_c0_g1_i1.p1  ORF type:complete len:274 (-),score=31.15 TRINITY_DN10704_c0_g1_i1:41-862(-)
MKQLISTATEKAKKAGYLFSLKTRPEKVSDGLEFRIQVAFALSYKTHTKDQPFKDPFENPLTQPLFIKEISPTHSLMLNKYNLVEDHVLIVTTKYEAQTCDLNQNDFEALLTCYNEIDGVGFFNCGPKSGSSQPHKHLQFIPLHSDNLPVCKLLTKEKCKAGEIFSISFFPFLQYCCKLEKPVTAEALLSHYNTMLQKISVLDPPLTNYNFLLLSDWIMLVPRTVDEFEGISVNSLGFTGNIYIKDEELLNKLIQLGPMTLLQKVTFPKPTLV